MHPKPVPLSGRRRNTLTKPAPAAAAPLYPPQMTLPGGTPSYTTSTSAVPTLSTADMTRNMAQLPGTQRPHLASEMAMMQDALKIAALKTAETIRYMSTVQRVGGSSHVKGPPPAVTNELRLQLARYDQLCDIVETRLVRAHASLSARLERERGANPKEPTSSSQKPPPVQIDSPMSDDVPLSQSKNPSQTALLTSNLRYTAAPKSRGLASLAAQRSSHATPDPTQNISPVTLASNAAMLPTLDNVPSHHAVVPELMNALRRRQEQEAKTALRRQPAQEASSMDIFGGTSAPSMDDMFMSDTNPGGVDLDLNSAVAAAIDASVGGMGPSVADMDSAVSAIHSAVPDMDSVAQLDSAVAEMAAAGDLNPLDPRTNDALFGDGADFGARPAQDSFASGTLQSRGFPGENLSADDPFATGDMPPGDAFPSVSGTGEDRSKSDLLADLDAEMNMDLIEMGGLGIGASEMVHAGTNPQGDELNIGEGGIGMEGGMGLGGVDITGGDMNINDVGIGGMDMGGDEIEAMWSDIGGPLDGFFSGMDADMGGDIQIKTEED